MKAVLISIQQNWCNKIATGEKTVEVRKTCPKLETPFKCYIYCTKSKKKTRIDELDKALGGGMVIGEFVCDRVYRYASDMFRTDPVEGTDITTEAMEKSSCLTAKELYEYEHSTEPKENCIHLVGVYGWNISNLKIYSEPKELGEFTKPYGTIIKAFCSQYIQRPPQSWCYVEEMTK